MRVVSQIRKRLEEGEEIPQGNGAVAQAADRHVEMLVFTGLLGVVLIAGSIRFRLAIDRGETRQLISPLDTKNFLA